MSPFVRCRDTRSIALHIDLLPTSPFLLERRWIISMKRLWAIAPPKSSLQVLLPPFQHAPSLSHGVEPCPGLATPATSTKETSIPTWIIWTRNLVIWRTAQVWPRCNVHFMCTHVIHSNLNLLKDIRLRIFTHKNLRGERAATTFIFSFESTRTWGFILKSPIITSGWCEFVTAKGS